MSKTHGNKARRKSDGKTLLFLCYFSLPDDRPSRTETIVIAWVVEVSCVINKIISDRLGKAHEAEKKKQREMKWNIVN